MSWQWHIPQKITIAIVAGRVPTPILRKIRHIYRLTPSQDPGQKEQEGKRELFGWFFNESGGAHETSIPEIVPEKSNAAKPATRDLVRS